MTSAESRPVNPIRTTASVKGWFAAIFILWAIAPFAACQSRSDVDWLVDVLQLKKGSVVADVGAGSGDQTLAIARVVGPEGRVYSTELGAGSVQRLRSVVERAGADNVTVVSGDPKQTNLSDECCDAIYMRKVYHHISDPPAFNRSLLRSLKPGGRLAIIDFEPSGDEAAPGARASGSSHGVTVKTLIKELRAAGFERVSSEKPAGSDIYVVMRKPMQGGG